MYGTLWKEVSASNEASVSNSLTFQAISATRNVNNDSIILSQNISTTTSKVKNEKKNENSTTTAIATIVPVTFTTSNNSYERNLNTPLQKNDSNVKSENWAKCNIKFENEFENSKIEDISESDDEFENYWKSNEFDNGTSTKRSYKCKICGQDGHNRHAGVDNNREKIIRHRFLEKTHHVMVMPLPVKDHGYSRHVIGMILGIPLLFLLIICPFLEFIDIQYSQYIPGKAKLGKFIVEACIIRCLNMMCMWLYVLFGILWYGAGMLDYLPRKEDMTWYNKWFASEESLESEFIVNQTDIVEWVQSTRRETFAR
ncbi:14017_t:CDS:2 [Cetraspora pellucida]|uniref:14017_t:CDS:1 n=1 Tax=Cetraspora pellucida TaxID=1433469 RepID=A0A9N9F4F7_9GLOM|nr:14017_t:CDS:2 [Cetraspora pellucida]